MIITIMMPMTMKLNMTIASINEKEKNVFHILHFFVSVKKREKKIEKKNKKIKESLAKRKKSKSL